MPVLRASAFATCVLAFFPVGSQHAQAQSAPVHSFTVSGRDFLMDGKPYQVISGEMHYPRIPREYWRDRLRKAKAMGLNTITTYAFWNLHEPRPGVYDFSGQNDLAAFLHDAQAQGLNVILRPGPYVCAEWELGGYPSWLLKDRTLTLRSTNPAYHAAVQRWFQRLAVEVKPLLLKNGGPIIAVQVENEYGAFGDDLNYLQQVKDDMVHAGLGDDLMFTSNQASDLAKGSLPDLPAAVNFGAGNAATSTAMLEKFRPSGPRIVGEYWAGWFDKWGEEHHETDGRKEAQEFQWMLEHGYSVSMYMFHGGSSFGWMNGADSHTGKDYHPDTTSYDYDAPLDESGSPRYKYALLQQAIATATHTSPMPVPKASERRVFPVGAVKESASLWDNLPRPVHSETPLTFEDLDQNFGYVLYRTTLPAHAGNTLTVNGLHDYAVVYVDRKQIGTLDRRLDQSTVTLPSGLRDGAVLDILVENTGRVNYSHAILTERTGITEKVMLGDAEVSGWEMFSLPMQDLSRLRFRSGACTGPCFFRTTMTVDRPADTFLDTRGLHKGQLWLGAHNLGRFWSIGPQFTLYTPAPWLHAGANRITWFDLEGNSRHENLTAVHDPVYGAVTHSRESQ
ncbi:beta-galactosidase family protein [Terriglobus sp. RCC_193]|uniref:glycoside hydrolase family 35 protein n=1 Tax=Terriglobus sp. RCC_193 TaxID=3239218 RepID=UPI003524D635